MEAITYVGQWLANAFVAVWSAIGTWGVVGVCLIAPVVLNRIGNLVKKIFQF